MTLGEGKGGITIDLLRRRAGEVAARCMEDMELKELAGVYWVVVDVFILDGVENTAEARRAFAAPEGERRPDPLEEGWEAGGEDCGGVPSTPAPTEDVSPPSKNVSRS